MRFLPYARLLRLPNVFTAFADIALGVSVASSLQYDVAYHSDSLGQGLAAIFERVG